MTGPLLYDPDNDTFRIEPGFDNRWWEQVLVNDEAIFGHIVPVGDTGSHILTEDCPCEPFLNGDGVWEHNAYDRREDYETGRRKRS